MDISITLQYIMHGRAVETGRTLETASALCREYGISHVDYMSEFKLLNWERNAQKEREILDKNGIYVAQSHAPFNRTRKYGDDSEYETLFMRSFHCAKILGAKYVVVHADQYRVTDRWDENEIVEYTYDRLAPAAEYCKKNGMVLAIENLFEDDYKSLPPVGGKSRFTSRIEEQLGIIERFHDPCVMACWDFGHALISYGRKGMHEALQKLGKYVVCTHVHDNNKGKDQHLLPFWGETDWTVQMRTLKEIGYKGTLSYEFSYGHIPNDLMKPYLNLVLATGRTLNGYFEGN